jgi:hypothetical protein
MALYSDVSLGDGGTGFQGDGPKSAAAMIKELQGLNVELLAGANANTKIAVAAIREGDTILKCLNNNAGTITDKTSTMSIVSVKASGTLTLTSAIATDAFSVNGKTYTLQAGAPTGYGQVQVGGTDTATATNMKNAINAYETRVGNSYAVVATSNSNVVTITARVDGTAGNAITISSADSTIVASGATLANGTATGGVMSTDATNQLILFWYNKQ